jgi:transcriptional regulator with XRE-family HTH domain
VETFRIRKLRIERGMTIAQLADTAEVSSALISQVERGLTDPSLATLRQIARVLSVPLFDLFEDPLAGDGDPAGCGVDHHLTER